MSKFVLVIAVIAVLLLAGCDPQKIECAWSKGKIVHPGTDDTYIREVYYNGMPCLLAYESGGKFATIGFTCDWSKWEER